MSRKRLAFFGVLLAIVLSIIFTAPLYGRPEFGDDCISCHTKGGITTASNITDIEVPTLSSFNVKVTAEGNTEELTIIWSKVADNPSFAFIPSAIIDNGANDDDPAENKVAGTFIVTAPTTPGVYTIQVFTAGSEGTGGTLLLEVSVISESPPTQNLQPTAYFLYSRRGMTIKFEDRSYDPDGEITLWQWNFGDNTDSTDHSPKHKFVEPGTYTVTLTVTDNQEDSNIQSQTFTVPSRKELRFLWGLQISIISVIIVFTTLFTLGIATRRKRKGTQSTSFLKGGKGT